MNKRVEDLEFRWSDTNQLHELVQWVQYEEGQNFKAKELTGSFNFNVDDVIEIHTRPANALDANEYCFVIAFFREGSEGCNIEFVGDRPFRYENRDRLWGLMRYGQRVVDAAVEFNG